MCIYTMVITPRWVLLQVSNTKYKWAKQGARKEWEWGSILDFIHVKLYCVKWTTWIYFLSTYYSTSGTCSDFLVQKDIGWILLKIKTFLMPADSPYDFEYDFAEKNSAIDIF